MRKVSYNAAARPQSHAGRSPQADAGCGEAVGRRASARGIARQMDDGWPRCAPNGLTSSLGTPAARGRLANYLDEEYSRDLQASDRVDLKRRFPGGNL